MVRGNYVVLSDNIVELLMKVKQKRNRKLKYRNPNHYPKMDGCLRCNVDDKKSLFQERI